MIDHERKSEKKHSEWNPSQCLPERKKEIMKDLEVCDLLDLRNP
jgi:hypothetical protein